MNNINRNSDESVKLEISKSIGLFSYKYGGTHNFEKQKCLFDLFNLKVPNNGYSKVKTSKVFDKLVVDFPEELMNGDIDDENEYLISWETGYPDLNVMAAEKFYQDKKPCWFVVYQIHALQSVYTTTAKYWEYRVPQISIVRTTI